MTDPVREAANRAEPRLQVALAAALDQARGEGDFLTFQAAYERGDIPGALAALGIVDGAFPALEAALEGRDDTGFLPAVAGLFIAAGIAAAALLSFRFNPANADPARARRELTATLRDRILSDAIESVTRTVTLAQFRGLNANQAFTAARFAVSLTPNQALSLDTLRTAFQQAFQARPVLSGRLIVNGITRSQFGQPRPDPERIASLASRNISAAQRSLLSSAIANEWTPSRFAIALDRHATQLAGARSKAVAITAGTLFANAGEHQAHLQAAAEGRIRRDTRRFWRDANDERVRPEHRQVSAMNPRGVGLNEPFRTPFGPVMFPPLEINCRCRVTLGIPQ